MSEKPHTVAIGAFVMGALLIAVTTVIFVLGSGLGADRSKVVMVFEGSVKGLSVGAPVALRGVQIDKALPVMQEVTRPGNFTNNAQATIRMPAIPAVNFIAPRCRNTATDLIIVASGKRIRDLPIGKYELGPASV